MLMEAVCPVSDGAATRTAAAWETSCPLELVPTKFADVGTNAPLIPLVVVAQLPAEDVVSPVRAGCWEQASEPERSEKPGCVELGTPEVEMLLIH